MKPALLIILLTTLAASCISTPPGYRGDPQSAMEIQRHLPQHLFTLHPEETIEIRYNVVSDRHTVEYTDNTYIVTLPGYNVTTYPRGFTGTYEYRVVHDKAAARAAEDILRIYRERVFQ